MNVLNVMEMRTSVRAYAPRAVERDMMETILRAGGLAPVFGRFHVTVVEHPELLRDIDRVTLDMMLHSGNDFLEKRASTEGYAPLYGAPALIILSAPGGNAANGFNMANVSCAAENMILAATELGLGSCCVMGPMMAFANPELAGRLGLPEGYVPLVGVLVGYALHGLKSNMRNESGNVTWLE